MRKEQLYLGGCKDGTDCDGHKKDGMVRHVKRRDGSENIKAVAEMKMEGKRPRGYDGRTLSEGTGKRGTSGRNGPLTGTDGKVSARPATPHRETAVKVRK